MATRNQAREQNRMEGENSYILGNYGYLSGEYNKNQQGVFAMYPMMTPKYALNRGDRNAEFRETMARMYLSLADFSPETKTQFLNSIPNDSRVQALAEILGTTDTGFIDFFLAQATETFNESVQIDKVLGDNYVVFFFGQEPPVFTYSGTLLNSQQDDQRTGFALAYQHLIRGTQLAKRSALLRLRYDSVIVSGTLLSTSQTLNAENELAVPFQFSLLVKEYVWLHNPKWTKVSKEQFIHLEADAMYQNAITGPVGRAQDVRVRTTINEPSGTEPLAETGEQPSYAKTAKVAAQTTLSDAKKKADAIYGGGANLFSSVRSLF